MTVDELIEQLKEFPGDATVVDAEGNEVEDVHYDDEDDSVEIGA